jgi:hypothetical protein
MLCVVLDEVIPRYRLREYHDILVSATPEVALRAILSLPARSDGVIATLFALRRIRDRGMTIGQLMAGMGLHPLTTDREYAGIFSPTTGIQIGVAFWAEPHEGGARLATETRVRTDGFGPGLAFTLYWLVVGPFSALIRRRWLAAAKRDAEGANPR